MEKSLKMSHEEVKNTIAQIYKEMEITLKEMDDISADTENGSIESQHADDAPLNDYMKIHDGENESFQDKIEQTVTKEQDTVESNINTKKESRTIEHVDQNENQPLSEKGVKEGDSRDCHLEEHTISVPTGNPNTAKFVERPEIKESECKEMDITHMMDNTIPRQLNDENNEILKMVNDIKMEVGRVVVGYDNIVENLLIALLAEGHVLLEGLPGIAKTSLAKTFTAILGMECQRIQFTPDMLPQDITGHFFFNQRSNDFEFRKGPIFSNLLLADEINRTTPRTQSALLESMEEGQATIEGKTFTLPKPFMVIATINPIEHDGVYQLPLAQSDRFMFKVNMGYTKKENELEFLKMKSNGNSKLDIPLRTFNISKLNEAYKNTFANDVIIEYINEIISSTRDSELISIGGSPRSSEHMLFAAKARACISGRDYVIPDDVKAVAYDLLNHRLLLSPDLDTSEFSISSVIFSILDKIKVPLEKR